MWQNPVLLPPFSNREDFNLTIGLTDDLSFDQNTLVYQPIDVSGITLASGADFTGSNWTVSDGGIVTSSTTPITIPNYPIGNQLSALALVVQPNLGILPGDPITIADPSGQNTMTGYVLSYTAASGALVCQIGCTFQFEIRIAGPHNNSSGYVPWYDAGVYPDYGPLLSASLGNGIMIVDTGVIQINIPEVQFRTLGALGVSSIPMDWGGTYRCGLTVTDSVSTRQVFIARLPVLSGGVTQ